MNISIPKKNINIFNNYLLDMNINTTKNEIIKLNENNYY